MPTLNRLEILSKFLGVSPSAGFSLEMVRQGLFEEQLKLASHSNLAAQENSLPMIKKTLPIGPPEPSPPPEKKNVSRREEEKTPVASESSSANVSSPSPSQSSEESPSPSAERDTSSPETSSPLRNQTPPSGESPSQTQSESPEPMKIVLSEDSPQALDEETVSGSPEATILEEISEKEASPPKELSANDPSEKEEETETPDWQAMVGEEGVGVVGSPQEPFSERPVSDQTPAGDQTVSLSGTIPPKPTAKAETSPGTFLPEPLPAEPGQQGQGFSEGQSTGQPSGSEAQQGTIPPTHTGQQRPGVSVPGTVSVVAASAAASQGVAVSTSASAVSGSVSAEGSGSAGSGSVSVGSPAGVSRGEQGASPANSSSSTANPAKTNSSTGPEESSQEGQVQRVRFVQRVARAFQTLRDGGGSVRLRLHPPELGSLRVDLLVRDGAMRARLEVENHAARTTLLEHLPMLRERLAQQDIRIEQFEVGLAGDFSGGSSQQPGDRMGEQQGFSSFSQSSSRSRPAETTAPPSGNSPLAASESTKLNVVV